MPAVAVRVLTRLSSYGRDKASRRLLHSLKSGFDVLDPAAPGIDEGCDRMLPTTAKQIHGGDEPFNVDALKLPPSSILRSQRVVHELGRGQFNGRASIGVEVIEDHVGESE